MVVAVIALLYFSFIIALLIHEVGHLLAILYTGYDFQVFAVGPVTISATEEGLKLGFRKALFKGHVKFSRNAKSWSLFRDVIVISGGIAANFIVGGALIWLYFLILPYTEISLFMIVGVISVIFGLTNLYPKHHASLGLDSDAMVLIRIYRYWKSQRKVNA